MYEKYVIEFFKYMNLYNEDIFSKLEENTKIIDKPYNEIFDLVGCYKVNDSCKLILPKIYTIYDVLIWIHEYSHALFLEDELEIFPNIMEAYFLNKFIDNIELKKDIVNNTNEIIKNSESYNHIIGNKIKLHLIKF